jgi:hypothetical protein
MISALGRYIRCGTNVARSEAYYPGQIKEACRMLTYAALSWDGAGVHGANDRNDHEWEVGTAGCQAFPPRDLFGSLVLTIKAGRSSAYRLYMKPSYRTDISPGRSSASVRSRVSGIANP